MGQNGISEATRLAHPRRGVAEGRGEVMKEMVETIWNAPAEEVVDVLLAMALGASVTMVALAAIVGIAWFLIFRREG